MRQIAKIVFALLCLAVIAFVATVRGTAFNHYVKRNPIELIDLDSLPAKKPLPGTIQFKRQVCHTMYNYRSKSACIRAARKDI